MFDKFIDAFLEGKKWAVAAYMIALLLIILAASALVPLISETAPCR